jgi:hypothetical protein
MVSGLPDSPSSILRLVSDAICPDSPGARSASYLGQEESDFDQSAEAGRHEIEVVASIYPNSVTWKVSSLRNPGIQTCNMQVETPPRAHR